jgi:hypothetical protein
VSELAKCLCYDGQACGRKCGPAKQGLFGSLAASTRSRPSSTKLTAAQVQRIAASARAVERKHLNAVKAAEEQEAATHAWIMASFGVGG